MYFLSTQTTRHLSARYHQDLQIVTYQIYLTFFCRNSSSAHSSTRRQSTCGLQGNFKLDLTAKTKASPLKLRPDLPTMASLKTLPNELLHKIVDTLVMEGLHGTAISLARTDKVLESRVVPRIYRSVVENETFFLAHWAADHGRRSTLKRAIEAGADINEPWTSYISAYEISKLGRQREYRRLRAAALDCKELQQAINKRRSLMAEHELAEELWYRSKESGYEEIDKDLMYRLFDYYVELDEEGRCNGLVDEFADAVETKIMFLDTFAFWAIPCHIAIREGNDEIVDALIKNKELDLNSSTYGNCNCTYSCSGLPSACAFSLLHQALCETKLFYVPQLIRLGISYLTFAKLMLDTTVDTLLVKPVLATPQARNLLHETLSDEWLRYWVRDAGWCMERHCCRDPMEWIINMLLDNGFQSRLHERDGNHQLAVQIACKERPNPNIIKSLLQHGRHQYDSSLRV